MIANQLAKSVGFNTSVIRYYTRIGLLRPGRNPENRYRQYAATDIERVRFIRKAKWLGFTLKDVQTILGRSGAGQSPCKCVCSIIMGRLRENRQRLKHLQEIRDRMEAAIDMGENLADGPQGRRVRRLIDSPECGEEKLDLYAEYRF